MAKLACQPMTKFIFPIIPLSSDNVLFEKLVHFFWNFHRSSWFMRPFYTCVFLWLNEVQRITKWHLKPHLKGFDFHHTSKKCYNFLTPVLRATFLTSMFQGAIIQGWKFLISGFRRIWIRSVIKDSVEFHRFNFYKIPRRHFLTCAFSLHTYMLTYMDLCCRKSFGGMAI